MNNSILRIVDLGRDYKKGQHTLTVLDKIDLAIEDREFVAITGPSGSGKSTLLGLLAGLDRPTRGEIYFHNQAITRLTEDDLSDLRGAHMGFVFQNFHLIPTLTALENVATPARLRGDDDAQERAQELLERVGLADRGDHFPQQLSGGEMQRVAIARASICRPSILFADEPTGNLDSKSGDAVMNLLQELHRECTLVLVTHNADLAAQSDREIRLRDGRLDDIAMHGDKRKSKTRRQIDRARLKARTPENKPIKKARKKKAPTKDPQQKKKATKKSNRRRRSRSGSRNKSR